ncbi:MAG: pyrroline-5-carboxylate reductase [Candidatus Methanosuratus sp.]|nr:pyrroline-5-carboxylate reductase [Candidatus Methanosuratincola sp.]
MISKIGLIGYGKMGSSLLIGGIKSGILKKESIKVYDIDRSRAISAEKYGLRVANSLGEILDSEVLILAVKPKDLPELLEKNRGTLVEKYPLLISIVAGISVQRILSLLEGAPLKVVRVIPNIAAAVNEAMSAFYANEFVSKEELAFVNSLLSGVGKSVIVENEGDLDTITGISGSGPAYFALMINILENVAIENGLREDLARVIAAQTCRGTASMILDGGHSSIELIKMVASPGGTTQEALRVMEDRGFSKIVLEAVAAAIAKSRAMNRS